MTKTLPKIYISDVSTVLQLPSSGMRRTEKIRDIYRQSKAGHDGDCTDKRLWPYLEKTEKYVTGDVWQTGTNMTQCCLHDRRDMIQLSNINGETIRCQLTGTRHSTEIGNITQRQQYWLQHEKISWQNAQHTWLPYTHNVNYDPADNHR